MTEPRRAPLSPTRQLAAAEDRLAAIAEQHREGSIGYCPECLLAWPCPTYTLAAGEPAPATDTSGTREVASL